MVSEEEEKSMLVIGEVGNLHTACCTSNQEKDVGLSLKRPWSYTEGFLVRSDNPSCSRTTSRTSAGNMDGNVG